MCATIVKILDGICHPGLNVKQVSRGPSKFTISELYLLAIGGQFGVPVEMSSHNEFLVCIPSF